MCAVLISMVFCYCRSKCRRQHIKERCQNKECEVKNCNFRHPQVCKFFRDIGYCKFGEWCYFRHIEKPKSLEEINELTEKLKGIEKSIAKKSEQIECLEKIIQESGENNQVQIYVKEVEAKFITFENNLQTMKVCLEEKDKYIYVLEGKIKDVKEKLEKVVDDKFNRLETLNEEIVAKMKKLEGDLPSLVDPTPTNDAERFQYTKCDFLTSSDQGMKIHMT